MFKRKPIYKSDEDIIEIARGRIGKYAERNNGYVKRLQYYLGHGKQGGGSVLSANSQGRPLLRYVGQSLEMGMSMQANISAPIVDDYQALLGQVPKVKSDPPSEVEQAQVKAEKLTKYLLSTYELSNMAQQQADAAFRLSCLGDAVYEMDADLDLNRVGIVNYNPLHCYPSFDKGWNRHRLYDLIRVYEEDPDVLEREFDYKAEAKGRRKQVVIYLSPWEKVVLIDEERVAQARHNLGFCPAVWMFNKMANGEMGMSDIRDVLALQDLKNYYMNVMADGATEMVYPPTIVVNPSAFPDQLMIGPGQVIPIEEGGDMRKVGPAPSPHSLMQMMDMVGRDIFAVSGTTSVRQEGKTDSSISTGRSIHAAQGPQATRIDLKLRVMAHDFRRINAMVLEMQERLPELADKKFEIHGRDKGREFRMDMESKEIEGMYATTVSWDALIGTSQPQRMVTVMQGMAADLIDDETGRDMIGIEDPVGMREKIESMHRFKAHLASIANEGQQGGQPQGGQQPPYSASVPGGSGDGVSLNRSQMVFRPPNGGGGGQPGVGPKPQIPGGVPQGVSLQAVETALAVIRAKIKSTVFAIGTLATSGQAMSGAIQIRFVGDAGDYRRIKDALAPIAPSADIRYLSSEANLPPYSQQVA